MKKILNILVLAMLTLTLSGCKKEEKVYTLKDLNHPALNTYTPGEKPGEKNIIFAKEPPFRGGGVFFISLLPKNNLNLIEIPETLKGGTLKKIEFKVATYTTAYFKHANLTDPNFKNSELLWEIKTQNKSTKLGSFELSYKNKTTEFKQTIKNEPITPSYTYYPDKIEKYVKTNTYTNYTWNTQVDCEFKIKEKSYLNFNLTPSKTILDETHEHYHLINDLTIDQKNNWVIKEDLNDYEGRIIAKWYVNIKTQFENNSYKFQNIANMFLDTIVIYDINLTILK